MKTLVFFLAMLTASMGRGDTGSNTENTYPFKTAKEIFTQSGGEIVKTFPTSFGMTGHVIKVKDAHAIAYETEDGKHLVFGQVLDNTGLNLTQVYAKEHIPAKSHDELVRDIQDNAMMFSEGSGSKTVYAFYEPHCSYCSLFYETSRSFLHVSTIHWIPVAFKKESSLNVIAGIVQSSTPATALSQYEASKKSGGSGSPLVEPDDKLNEAIMRNYTFLTRTGKAGTPAYLYQDGSGSWVVGYGNPNNLAKLRQIFGGDPRSNNVALRSE